MRMNGAHRPVPVEGTTRTLRVFLALAGAAALLSCSDLNGSKQVDNIDAAQARWQSAHMTRYVFQFSRSCFCAEEITRTISITVVGGAPVGAVYVDSGTTVDTTLFRNYLTVDRIFAYLHSTLNAHPALLTASYEATLGYPLQVYIDPVALTVDDEVTLRILSLTAAP